MKTLKLTDEQYAFIQHLREEIAADVVGKYGFVREQDAVQFMIDNLADEVDIDGDFEASATDDVAASVVAAIEGTTEPDHLDSVSYIESAETATPAESADDATASAAPDQEPADDDAAADDEGDAAEAIDPDGDSEDVSEEADDEPADEPDDAGSEGDDAADEADEDGDDEEESADDEADDDGDDESNGAADDDDMLDRMMSLLDTHDDKWEESSSADFRYTVTLPDGSEENVQTKDDVRALLFKNYR